MKISVYYFSGTGNTKRIAELYKAAFEQHGADITLRKLPLKPDERISEQDIVDNDMIGIGYPIHAFNAPKNILTLCKALPKLDKKHGERKRVFIFKSSGEPVRMSDVSSLKMRKILRRRGYTVDNEYQYVMPYNIIFRHSDAAAYKMWQTAQALVPLHVNDIIDGTPSLPKKMFMGGFLAWILRAEHWGAHINGKFYKATEDCVKCGKCVKLCPVNNIKTKKNGKIKFGGKCIMCMRCAMYCPKNAINIGLFKGWKVNGAYSLEKPTDEAKEQDKHADYCKKAYDRYYAAAEQKIEQNKNTDLPTT